MTTSLFSRTGAVALVAALSVVPVWAEDSHVQLTPDALQWAPAPAALPAGAEGAILFGDPAAEGQFGLRLRLPAGYHIAPHSHPAMENITVISGTFGLGMGQEAEKETVQLLPAGSFVSMSPGSVHYVYTDEETVVQLNSVGPWGLTYADPADDPRKTN